MVSQERINKFMALEKIDPNEFKWIGDLVASGDFVRYDPDTTLQSQVSRLGSKTLLIIEKADKTSFYALCERIQPITPMFKIYNPRKHSDWIIAEVRQNA